MDVDGRLCMYGMVWCIYTHIIQLCSLVDVLCGTIDGGVNNARLEHILLTREAIIL